MKAEIITIGDELLIGQTVDTNSAWIGNKLSNLGLEIHRIVSISDKESEIISTIDAAFAHSDVLIVTGGLGPTNDDITKHTLCKYFNTELEFHEEAFENMKKFVLRRRNDINENNRRQAMFPKSAEFIPNLWGTASGMLFKKKNSILVSLPGVPHEMRNIMEEFILPKVEAMMSNEVAYHENVLTMGIPEAELAELISNWEQALQPDISLAYLPSSGFIKLRLSTKGASKDVLKSRLNSKIEELIPLIKGYYIGKGFENLEEFLADYLSRMDKTISFAESCTGGYITEMFTSMPGASKYLKGSVVAYSNEIKENVLNVGSGVINEFGAVSKAVVEQMAINIRMLFNTDFAISTSGIAGPNGGTEEKPVGTVWIAVANKDKCISKKFQFGTIREINIRRSAYAGIGMLLQILQED